MTTPTSTATRTTLSGRSLRLLGLALGTTAALLAAPLAGAATGSTDAQSRYQQERAVCLNGQSNQDRATCLQEAGAALQEARRDRLGVTDEQQLSANRVSRCAPLPAADREDCMMRMKGEGVVSGNAPSGGIFRELTRTIPVPN